MGSTVPLSFLPVSGGVRNAMFRGRNTSRGIASGAGAHAARRWLGQGPFRSPYADRSTFSFIRPSLFAACFPCTTYIPTTLLNPLPERLFPRNADCEAAFSAVSGWLAVACFIATGTGGGCESVSLDGTAPAPSPAAGASEYLRTQLLFACM